MPEHQSSPTGRGAVALAVILLIVGIVLLIGALNSIESRGPVLIAASIFLGTATIALAIISPR